MQDFSGSLAGGSVTVVLWGGPTDLPEMLRTQCVAPSQEKIKIMYRGGYEHFERDGAVPSAIHDAPVVFRWTMRTKIAE